MVLRAELQAVIMAAGKGSRMTELTAKKPKCLLPVGHFPMIWYPLNLLTKSGFTDAIIVVLESNKSEIQTAVEKLGLSIKTDIVSIPLGEDWGTADSLRHLQDTNRLKSDVLILSCDLITNVSLSPLFELYRKHDAALTALFTQLNTSPVQAPGPVTKYKMERDFIAIDESTSRLVFIASASDYEKELPLPCKLIKTISRVTLSSNLFDAHVYILNQVLCKYLAHNRNIGTLKGELLPLVVKKQTQVLPKKIEQDKATSIVGVDLKTDLLEMSEESDLVLKSRNMSSYTDSRLEPAYRSESLRCYGYLAEGVTIRANSLVEYTRANKTVLENWTELTGLECDRVSPLATIQSTQLETDTCLVGERVSVSEKTSIKSTVLSPGSAVGTKTRISGSVLMASVSVGVGCNIQNSIICEESVISDGCELKDCVIGSHYIMPPGGKHNHEIVTDEDRLMEMTL